MREGYHVAVSVTDEGLGGRDLQGLHWQCRVCRTLALWGSPSKTDETVLSRKSAAVIMGAPLPSRPLVWCGVPAHDRYGRALQP